MGNVMRAMTIEQELIMECILWNSPNGYCIKYMETTKESLHSDTMDFLSIWESQLKLGKLVTNYFMRLGSGETGRDKTTRDGTFGTLFDYHWYLVFFAYLPLFVTRPYIRKDFYPTHESGKTFNKAAVKKLIITALKTSTRHLRE